MDLDTLLSTKRFKKRPSRSLSRHLRFFEGKLQSADIMIKTRGRRYKKGDLDVQSN